MKKIDVQQQPILSFVKIVHIALSGVKYRLFRAVVTLSVIAVAMAFLMNILTESLLKRDIAEAARDGISTLHRTDRWIARLSVPQSYEDVVAALAAPDAFTTDRAIYGEPSEAEQQRITERARQAMTYLRFFDELNYGRRRVLVGAAASTRIFDVLGSDPARRKTFDEALHRMRAVRLPTSRQAFDTFLDEWPDLRTFVQTVRANQQHAIDQLQEALGARDILEAMQEADGSFGEAIRAAGFDLPREEAEALVRDARRVADRRLIEDTINHPGMRQAIAARYDLLPGDVTTDLIWRTVDHPRGGQWYLESMRENDIPLPERLDTERLAKLAASRSEARLLVRAELMTAETGGGVLGIGERMSWLLFVSMLVCIVGIANAMLMSVTERFREIATLKCLGALDGFIMTVFLIEAAILGFVGGLVGTLIGLVVCFLRMTIGFRALVFESLSVPPLALAAGISVILGVMLAAVAAVYPSFRAARLAPMEAMRIE